MQQAASMPVDVLLSKLVESSSPAIPTDATGLLSLSASWLQPTVPTAAAAPTTLFGQANGQNAAAGRAEAAAPPNSQTWLEDDSVVTSVSPHGEHLAVAFGANLVIMESQSKGGTA